MNGSRPISLALLASLALVGCGQEPSPGPGPASDEPSTPDTVTALPAGATDSIAPLLVIMQRLERDVQDLHRGVWLGDLELVAASARSIANHPRVPPEEREAIAAILGDQFGGFAALDREVHDLAVAIADSASVWSPERVLDPWNRMARACLACHARYRDRLTEAGYSEP